MTDREWEIELEKRFERLPLLEQLYLIQKLTGQIANSVFLDSHRDPNTGELPEEMRHLEPYPWEEIEQWYSKAAERESTS